MMHNGKANSPLLCAGTSIAWYYIWRTAYGQSKQYQTPSAGEPSFAYYYRYAKPTFAYYYRYA
jgi:hypothetical protein